MFIFRYIAKFFKLIGKIFHAIGAFCLGCVGLGIVLILGYGFLSAFYQPSIPKHSVLVLDLAGEIRELPTESPLSMQLLGNAEPMDTVLYDVIASLDNAAKDDHIDAVLLKLDQLSGAGINTVREIGLALDRFKTSGKPIFAWGTNFSQVQYSIAAHANEIYLHPMGFVGVKGLSSDRLYYGDLLKNLGVNIHVFKAGAYKSFPESFTRNSPSREWIEAESYWLNDAWHSLAADIEHSRGLIPGSVNRYIDTLVENVSHSQGNLAQAALQSSLIDGIKTYDSTKHYIEEKLSKGTQSEFNFISVYDYSSTLLTPISAPVAVLIAEGEIREGESEPGVVGAETLIDQIQALKEQADVKALVLRVNSPGGSAVASELIRHALERTKAVKPVVVSMGDMAASGGYWISMGGSRVLASEATVTGSIGVFGLAPTFERTLQLAKIGQAAVTTTWLANAERLSQPMDPRMESILTQSVARTYSNFINVVAQSRKLSTQYVQSVAQGRVWTGTQAQSRQLVDQIGNFGDALSLARSLAKMDTNAGAVYLIDSKPDFGSMIRENFGDWFNPLGLVGVPESVQKELKQGHSLLQKAEGRSQLIFVHSLLQPLQ